MSRLYVDVFATYDGDGTSPVPVWDITTGSQTDFVFANTGGTITNSGSVDFTTIFTTGQQIRVTETTSNNGLLTITGTVTATVLTITESLTDESPAACTITAEDDGLTGPANDFKTFWAGTHPYVTLANNDQISIRTKKTLTASTDISFDSGTKVITTSGAVDFSQASVKSVIEISGSTSNDGSYIVSASTSTTITVLEALVTEAAGQSITVAQNAHVALTATVTCGIVATAALPTVVRFDDGTVWSEEAGRFRISVLNGTTGAYAFYFKNYVPVLADGTNHRLEFYNDAVTRYAKPGALNVTQYTYIDGLLFTIQNNFTDCQNGIFSSAIEGVFENLRVDNASSVRLATYYNLMGSVGYGDYATFINYEYYCTTVDNDTRNVVLFGYTGRQGSMVKFIGGGIYGNAKLTRLIHIDNAPCDVTVIDFNADAVTAGLSYYNDYPGNRRVRFKEYGAKGDLFAASVESVGRCEYQDDNYPYIDAFLPDGKGWSWRVSPQYATPGVPFELDPIYKHYNAASAVKTLTLELLINVNFNKATMAYTSASGSFTDGEVIEGQTSGALAICQGSTGTDITGTEINGVFEAGEIIEGQTSLETATLTNDHIGVHAGIISAHFISIGTTDATNIDATFNPREKLVESTASWSTTSYATKDYKKYKIAVTTANSIKQDSRIIAVLTLGVEEVATDDYFFVHPDIIIS